MGVMGHKVGDQVELMYGGRTLPRGTVLVVTGSGVAAISQLPPEPLKVGDVIDTAEQASTLPVGSVVVDEDPAEEFSASRPAIKTGLDDWLFHSALRPVYEGDDLFDDNPHRVVYIPNADAGAGS